MGDQERFRRIAELYGLMQAHYGFARGFTAEVTLLVRARQRELLELEQMEGRYE